MIAQIKEKDKTSGSNSNNWFKNKVLGKAVKQIKDTIRYFDLYNDILIENERGHILNISEAKKIEPIKLIIYSPDENFMESNRFQKFYKSSQVGLIHLFHIEDYLWICKYLITPFEIEEYLKFRESLFRNHEDALNKLPEQYTLGHYIETLDVKTINLKYIKNLTNLIQDVEEFDISFIVENFKKNIRLNPECLDYYAIIKEIAKLNRADLREFKKRYNASIDKAKEQKFTLPYRMTSLNSNCGFVFIPIEFKFKDKWQNAIINCTQAHKYDQRLNKTIGMIVYYNPTKKYFDLNWCYVDSEWSFDQEFENFLKESNPFRPVNVKTNYRYNLNE